jgi:beta-porphyranase
MKNIFFKILIASLILCAFSCSTSDGVEKPGVEVDTEKPVLNCPDNISIAIGATDSNPVVTYETPKATDNVNAITSQTEGLPSGSIYPVGTTTNTFKATDAAGNSATCSFDVIVTRAEPSADVPYFIGGDPTPTGKKWETITAMTDEFDGSEINSKWHTEPATHPHLKWVGRSPAMFKKENVKLNNGKLTIEVNKLPAPVTTYGWGTSGTLVEYTFSGGNLRSLVTTNVGNYHEVKMKMNKTEMGGGFWLMGFNGNCNKKHEIDITESVGIESKNMASWAKNQGWTEIYHSNAIRREDSCDSNQKRDSDYKKTPTKNHERYYVYGCWRKSATELLFYLDGVYQYTLTPPVPFDQEMYLQFSIESYDWNPIPANGSFVETASLEDRTTFIEYIRSFKLID